MPCVCTAADRIHTYFRRLALTTGLPSDVYYTEEEGCLGGVSIHVPRSQPSEPPGRRRTALREQLSNYFGEHITARKIATARRVVDDCTATVTVVLRHVQLSTLGEDDDPSTALWNDSRPMIELLRLVNSVPLLDSACSTGCAIVDSVQSMSGFFDEARTFLPASLLPHGL